MGGSPEAPTSASGRGNQPAGGDPESNRGCPGPVTSREMATIGRTSVKPALSLSSWVKVQSNQGPVHTGVTVVAAPNGKRSKVVQSWHHFLNGLLAPKHDREILHDETEIHIHSPPCSSGQRRSSLVALTSRCRRTSSVTREAVVAGVADLVASTH